MNDAQKLYLAAGRKIPLAEESRMFGKPCFKINGRAFIAFYQDCLVCKLKEDDHKKALSLEGAPLFDPSGKKRPMKEWVQVPYQHSVKWPSLAKSALNYVSENN